MKNLKRLSRVKLKNLKGGNNQGDESGWGEGCEDTCVPNGGNSDDICKQYGLKCGFFQCGEQLVNRCM